MKAIQVSFDERLLRQLDADEEVRRDGRSAVLRRAADLYLARRRERRIAAAYRAAYGRSGAGADLAGWEDEGAWPDA
jgi:metal-responsive CopG/Arc/MetJ family transcriptional regulator